MKHLTTDDNQIYQDIRNILENARQNAYRAVNVAMVEAYWAVGKMIAEASSSSSYGDNLIKFLSEKLTAEFGKGFDSSNLKRMRQFYLVFQKGGAMRHQLSWTYYRLLSKVEKDEVRNFYIEECIASNWSTRQLERQIKFEQLTLDHYTNNMDRLINQMVC